MNRTAGPACSYIYKFATQLSQYLRLRRVLANVAVPPPIPLLPIYPTPLLLLEATGSAAGVGVIHPFP
jgi:hypothetical protein